MSKDTRRAARLAWIESTRAHEFKRDELLALADEVMALKKARMKAERIYRGEVQVDLFGGAQ